MFYAHPEDNPTQDNPLDVAVVVFREADPRSS
jgi:hypothetical protein